MNQVVTEWVNVNDTTTIVACDAGGVWYQSHQSVEDQFHRLLNPFANPMTSKGAPASTVGLLDGAISLGFGEEDNWIRERKPSPIRYVYSLVGAYYTSKDTPRNLLNSARRFREIERFEVAKYLEMRANEETGHHRLVLKDLSSLGLPAKQIVTNLIPVGIMPLCDLFDHFSSLHYPIDCIGFSYCSERIAAIKPKSEVNAVKALFGDGSDATRFLRSHSSLGSEVSHVDETIEFVSNLPPDDRIQIVRATYQSALLMAERQRLESEKSEAEIQEDLEKAAGKRLDRMFPQNNCRTSLQDID
jgi:hypothetical protein